jgi:hypothetical protein
VLTVCFLLHRIVVSSVSSIVVATDGFIIVAAAVLCVDSTVNIVIVDGGILDIIVGDSGMLFLLLHWRIVAIHSMSPCISHHWWR